MNKERIATLDHEVWRPHPKWPFDVSTLGRVRSQKSGRIVGYVAGGELRRNRRPGTLRVSRYRQVTVRSGRHAGTNVSVYEHVLVLETFVGPRPDGHEADHINNDGFDNRLVNLQWLTHQEHVEKTKADRRARKLATEAAAA